MRCEACRSHFELDRARARFCPSCLCIIAKLIEELQSLADLCGDLRLEVGRKARGEFDKLLECPWCGWSSNWGRIVSKDMRLNRIYAETWAIRRHKHFMKHVFWNRFPGRSKFKPTYSRRRQDFESESEYRNFEGFYRMLEELDRGYNDLSTPEQIEQVRKMRAQLRSIVSGKDIRA